ncbi:MAG: hypothetical protein ACKVKO_02570 [Acidimicrobiales bacterium]
MALRRGVYPGSFNPPTIAHMAIAEAAREQRSLDQIVFAISSVALAKPTSGVPDVDVRARWVRDAVAHWPWAKVEIVAAQLLVDIAAGFDVVIMGEDKWEQINDPQFYGHSDSGRDAALARLPELAIAPRRNHAEDQSTLPDRTAIQVDSWTADVSSTAVRQGSFEWRAQPN